MLIDNKTKLFFSAAKSPGNFGATVYNSLFNHYQINAVYLPKRFDTAESIITALSVLDIQGCSITMPFKSDVLKFLDVTNDIVDNTFSVNTIVKKQDKLYGYNTDYFAVQQIIKPLDFKTVLVYGSGSVTNTVIHCLIKNGIKPTVVSRNKEALKNIYCNYYVEAIYEKDFVIKNNSFDLLINCTPVSNNEDSFPFELLKVCNQLFDLVVDKKETRLCKVAKQNKKKYIKGCDMSKWQLQNQFLHYIGFAPNMDIINRILNSQFYE